MNTFDVCGRLIGYGAEIAGGFIGYTGLEADISRERAGIFALGACLYLLGRGINTAVTKKQVMDEMDLGKRKEYIGAFEKFLEKLPNKTIR